MNFTQFDNFFKKFKNFTVYVGFSGGADSTSIIHISNYYKQKYHFKLIAINFEHGIRGSESIEDTIFCKQLCKQLNIPITVISLSINHDTKNIEAVAREKRIEYYKKLCKNKPNAVVLLGHHFDDKIENFFIRLARGSNLSGLFGLKQTCNLDGVLISRPLLNIHKNEIVEFLKDNNYQWRTDSTNLSNQYQRNYIRNTMLPDWYKQCQFIKGGVKTSIENLELDNDFIEQYANIQFTKFYNTFNNCDINCKQLGYINDWIDLHPAIRFRVLKKTIQLIDGQYELSKGVFEQFNKLLTNYNNTDHKFLKINKNVSLIIKGYLLYIQW